MNICGIYFILNALIIINSVELPPTEENKEGSKLWSRALAGLVPANTPAGQVSENGVQPVMYHRRPVSIRAGVHVHLTSDI